MFNYIVVASFMIFRISSIYFREVSGIAKNRAFVRTGSIRILLPRVSVDSATGISVGMITGVVSALSVGVLVEMIIGLRITFGGRNNNRNDYGSRNSFWRSYLWRENPSASSDLTSSCNITDIGVNLLRT